MSKTVRSSYQPSNETFGEAASNSENATSSVKELASKAADKLMNTAQEQKQAGAEFMVGMAGAVRRAAGEFDGQMPEAARYIRSAADQLTNLSDAFRRRDIGQMVADVESFARRQPTAFLGLSFFAGFAAVRFLRSSASSAREGNFMSQGTSGMPGAMPAGSSMSRDSIMNRDTGA